MGQAKRRGSIEQRIAQAVQRVEDIKAAAEAQRRLRQAEEDRAWDMMSEEEYDLTVERVNARRRRKHNSNMAMASLLGMCYGGFGAIDPRRF